MNLSRKWLSEFVDVTVGNREFSEKMTMSGSKVEGWEDFSESIKNVVVGQIKSITKVENSDKLLCCMIDAGKDELLQIVTGASNVYEGAYVPVALDGSTLPGGVKIKKGKLRGVESNGMLCSIGELNLTQNDFPTAVTDGIFLLNEEPELNGKLVCGDDITKVLGLDDVSVEFEITSNRPDCLSVIGLAREASATFGVPLKLHNPEIKGCDGDVNDYISVDVKNTELCRRYIAGVVKNVKIEPSPMWLRERLRASGVRPINNLVDITNYVMLEYGHPMHAFDLRYVNGGKIIPRNAKPGEKIMMLDGVERDLSEEMLVIADEKGPMAVAGVMGGEYSGIMDDTDTVVFESACFDGVSVRTTAKKLGVRTDASARFEKDIDAGNAMPAIKRALELVEILGAGEVVGGLIDCDYSEKAPKKIKLEPEWTNKFLGIDISKEEMIKSLEALGFTVDENDDITVPGVRIDIEHKADIAEEIARIYGYDKIPTTKPMGTAEASYTPEQKFERKIVSTLLAAGCYEVQTYSFVSPKVYDKLTLPADSPLRKCVEISNPLGEDTSVMRTTTIPSMLDVLSRNYNNRNESGKFFELGKTYIPVEGEKLPDERVFVTLGMYGKGVDFFTVKGVIETLFDALGVKGCEFEADASHCAFHPGRTAKISNGETEIGFVGEIHPAVLDNYEIGTKAYAAELSFDKLFALSDREKTFKPMPKFPAVTRDLSLICDEDIPVRVIEKAIAKGAGKLLESLTLFDVYQGEQVEKGKKSVSYSLKLRSKEGTLTEEQSSSAVNKCLGLLKDLGIEIRS
ncbi:MAG: phenylalanine--tRNA ligase subunit beta [Oscillospiraceae bacterium]